MHFCTRSLAQPAARSLLQGQSNLRVIRKTNGLSGLAHILQAGHKSSGSVGMAHGPQASAQKGLGAHTQTVLEGPPEPPTER